MATNNPSDEQGADETLSLHGMSPEEAIQRATGTAPAKKGPFAIGDRVQVTEAFPHLDFRNATGVVIPALEAGDDDEGLAWVEFDAPMRTPHGTSTQAVGIGVQYLRPI